MYGFLMQALRTTVLRSPNQPKYFSFPGIYLSKLYPI